MSTNYNIFLSAMKTTIVCEIVENIEANTMQGHSKPHVFKIEKKDNKAVISYKRWSTYKVGHFTQLWFIDKLIFKDHPREVY